MPRNLTQKLVDDHLVEGRLEAGAPIALRIDQTLTQDATGTLVMLQLEASGIDRVKTEVSAQYVDHNLIQEDAKNPDDHRFLREACERFGIWYSRAGNGVSHPVHQERFGVPGKTLLGSDSHTPAAGAIAMLAIGAGGQDVALAMAGEPYATRMPEVWGVELTGSLSPWVSAKDVILEMLRRHGVEGGRGRVVEYFGRGVAALSAMDRHVIANMGTELGATTSVFPSDEETKRYLRGQRRADAYRPLTAEEGASYDHHEHIELDRVEPLVALPSSPGNVVPIREVAGKAIGQAYIGSSANPGYRDFAVPAEIVRGRQVPAEVSLDVNPTSRQILQELVRDGHLGSLIGAGARIHQAGCNGCIGMGQAPASEAISLRTVPRNFPGRSGTKEDMVHLCSPESAAASALMGVITDPRTLDMDPPAAERVRDPDERVVLEDMLHAPSAEAPSEGPLPKGPNIKPMPELEALPETLEIEVLLVVGDDISTDEILPAGAKVLPFRSNIPEIARFAFEPVDADYPERARKLEGGHAIVGGRNYGQGSSREHAALAPRHLGLRVVFAESFARIHERNLANFGVLPLRLEGAGAALERGATLRAEKLREQLEQGEEVVFKTKEGGKEIRGRHELAPRERDVVLAGGLVNWMRERVSAEG